MSEQDKILTPEEQTICEQLTTAAAPHGQRAVALLALNEGLSQAEARQRSGLSVGQVKYCLRRFRQVGLGMFPDELLSADQAPETPAPAVELVVAGVETEVNEATGAEAGDVVAEVQGDEAAVAGEPSEKVEKSKEAKKKKKVKQGKRVKKDKTEKKSKQDKKSKKKKKKAKKNKDKKKSKKTKK